jgi:NAD(P)-dependent dehydrogenase (short-subunit alcohol dehydrogenase family)
MSRDGAPAGADLAQYLESLAAYPYMKRIGAPDEVAAAILYLASDAAAFVTGAMWSIDGGSTAGR